MKKQNFDISKLNKLKKRLLNGKFSNKKEYEKVRIAFMIELTKKAIGLNPSKEESWMENQIKRLEKNLKELK